MKKGLSGYVPIKNNFDLDYTAHLAVRSLLPVCDEVIVVDGGSTDQTIDFFLNWQLTEPKIKIISYAIPRLPTPDEVLRDDPGRPKSDARMLIPWLNHGRSACEYDMQITLDADEVLDPEGYESVRDALRDRLPRWMRRVNLWPDPDNNTIMEAPHGTVCGEVVCRMGPTEMEMCSDEPRPEGEPDIRVKAIRDPKDKLKIFHLGFLRRQDAFLKKSRVVQGWLHNCYDPRLRAAERGEGAWYKLSPFPAGRPLLGYPNQDWPDYVNEWIKNRGWRTQR